MTVDHTARLKGVEPRLIAVLLLASHRFCKQYNDNYKIRVTSGVRSRMEQERLFNQQKSWTMQSRHLNGAAVDICILNYDEDETDIYKGVWKADWDFDLYHIFNGFMDEAAAELGVALQWGGHWPQRDGVHWEITNLKLFP